MHLFGVAGMSITQEEPPPEATGLVTAFIPGDVLKAIIACMLTAALAKARPGVAP